MGKTNRDKAKAANYHDGQDGFKIKALTMESKDLVLTHPVTQQK